MCIVCKQRSKGCVGNGERIAFSDSSGVREPDVCLPLECLTVVLEGVFQNLSIFLVGKTLKPLVFSSLLL